MTCFTMQPSLEVASNMTNIIIMENKLLRLYKKLKNEKFFKKSNSKKNY